MQKNYTDLDYIRLRYNETTSEETASILNEMLHDDEFASVCQETEEVIQQLDDASLAPHPTTLQLIFEYSQKLHQTV
jgi:hypothetical protein